MSQYDSMLHPSSLCTYDIQGIYVTNEEAKKMSKDVGFGIRIEDAVLVTADGGIVMTGARAKSPYEPQMFMSKLSRLPVFKVSCIEYWVVNFLQFRDLDNRTQ